MPRFRARVYGGRYDRRAFGLGFFAAVAIVVDHVALDLGGFTIEQSVEHALTQRFYAAIELADVPFHYDQGTMTSTSFWGHLSRISQLCPDPHALWAMLYLVPMLIGC